MQLTLTKVAGAHDLSLTQLRLLGILVDRTLAMAELANYLGLDRSSVSGLVDRTQMRGPVERERRREDGRGVQVRITSEGLALAHGIRTDLTPQVRALTAP